MFTVIILISVLGIGFCVWRLRNKPSDATGIGGGKSSDTKEK